MTRQRHTTQYRGIRYRLVREDRPDGPRRYIISYRDANGVDRTETLPVGCTLEDARLRKAALERDKRTLVPTRKTVGELLDEWLEMRRDDLQPNTLEGHRHAITALKDVFGNRKLRDLTASDIARFISTQKRAGMKASTVKRQLSPLVGALKVAVREGWIQSNPMDSLLPYERPKSDARQMRCLERDEIERLLAAASTERDRALFSVLTFCGLRISEALALQWKDVDFQAEVIHVRNGKTAASRREVFMIPALKTLLRRIGARCWYDRDSYVFVTRTGRILQRRQALKTLRQAEKAAGLPEYTLHELRHTFASILISQGETPVLVAHQMGHSDPSVTLKVYAHLFDAAENVQLAKDRLQEAFGPVLGQVTTHVAKPI